MKTIIIALLLAAASITRAEKMTITFTFTENSTNDLVTAYNVYAARTGTTNWTRLTTTFKPPVTVTVTNASTFAFTSVNPNGESAKTPPIVVPWIVYGAKWTRIIINK